MVGLDLFLPRLLEVGLLLSDLAVLSALLGAYLFVVGVNHQVLKCMDQLNLILDTQFIRLYLFEFINITFIWLTSDSL